MSKGINNCSKKILFVSKIFWPKGLRYQKQLTNITNGFRLKGYEVSIFLFRGKKMAGKFP